MNFKLYFILIFSLVFILTIGAISASEDIGDDAVGIDEDSSNIALNDVGEKTDILSSENENTETLMHSNESETLKQSDDNAVLTSSASTTKSTTKLKTTIKASKTTVAYNSYLTVVLKDSKNNAVKSKTVKMVINKKTYTAKTNSNGQAKILIKLAPGKYKAKFTFSASGNYKSSSKTSTIKITKAKPTITASAKTFKRTVATKKYTVTLKNNRGTVMKNTKLTLKVNGKTYSAKTNSKGVATFKITKLTKTGKYSAVIKYAGTKYFKAVSKTAKITVAETTSSSTSTSTTTNSSTVTTNETRGQLIVSGETVSKSGVAFTYTTSDSNTILVQNGGYLTLKNSTVYKGGDLTNTNSEDSEFYGTNAAILVTAKSTLNISDCEIVTNATGANAIFVSNLDSLSSGATAYISNVVINTYKDKSRGLDATFGGTITADNVTIYTRGGSCASLATDRGEGTLVVTNSKIYTGVGQTSGSGSPLIYSTGDITVSNTTGTSYVSQIACVEGKNSITLSDCNLVGYGKGNREVSGVYVDLAGVFIYQSMSGDADVGTAQFSASNSNLTIASDSSYYTSAPMFFVTNTKATISLDNCTLNFGSGVLLNAAGQSQWGTSGSNGGEVTFTASNMDLSGNIVVDSISTLDFTLTGTAYTGAVNTAGTYGETNLVIGSTSSWTLTEDSYVTSLSNSGTINYGSHTLYVGGVAYSASSPYTG